MTTATTDSIDLLRHDSSVATNERYTTTRAHWAVPEAVELGAPAHRIIHSRALMLAGPARLDRLGIRPGQGYFKCGSEPNLIDWVRSFRVRAFRGGGWTTLVERHDLPRPDRWSPEVAAVPLNERETEWYDLGGTLASGVLIEIRRAGVDGWWPCWDLASTAFVLEGKPAEPNPPPAFRAVTSGSISLAGLPSGVTAQLMSGEVRYRTPSIEVGFSLGRPGMTWLSVDDEAMGRHAKNLLAIEPVGLSSLHTRCQGLLMQPVGAPAVAGPNAWDYDGTVTVDGGRVHYRLDMPACAQQIELVWQVRSDGLALEIVRNGSRDVRVWAGSLWTIVYNAQVAATTTLGPVNRGGQAGLVNLPLLLHSPGYGSLRVTSHGPGLSWRADAIRPSLVTSSELMIGAVPQTEGDYLLLAGDHSAKIDFQVSNYQMPMKDNVPPSIRRAVQRCGHTALPYRPDTATLSNNGCSIHSPICADVWGMLAVGVGDVLPGFGGIELLRDTLERSFDGGPGYASGAHPFHQYPFELEYLLVDVAMLAGLADYLSAASDSRDWLTAHAGPISAMIARVSAADLDGDGLIESNLRTGVSGSHQWSTNWFDVISFGWKDAYVNAALYDALTRLQPSLRAASESTAEMDLRGIRDWSKKLDHWASTLKATLPRVLLERCYRMARRMALS